jgi:hypothetical protein
LYQVHTETTVAVHILGATEIPVVALLTILVTHALLPAQIPNITTAPGEE